MVQISNVFERTLALLVAQFRDQKPDGTLTNFQKLIKILCEEKQVIQDVLWQLKTERSLSSAIGQQLDGIGEILGLPRNEGETDEDYRESLQFQVFINSSSGTPEQILTAIKFLTKADIVRIFEPFPAFFQLETNGLNFPTPPNDLNDAIFNMSPAGVNYAPITATYGVSFPLRTSNFDIRNYLLSVNSNNESLNLLMMPYNENLSVTNASNNQEFSNGWLDELGFPSNGAGQIAELIQKDGNKPPRR